MQIGIVSDTHGAADLLLPYLERQGIEHLFFAGDFYQDGEYLANKLHVSWDGVAGNCDFGSESVREKLMKYQGHRILLTHGHKYGVKRDMQRLLYRAQELQANLVVFGHTHVPLCEQREGIWFINPGSPVYPRLAGHESFAVLQLKRDSLAASIVYLYG